jgi:hypothetical protein
MAALEKATSSAAWGTVSAVMKDGLANVLASGDTEAILDLTSPIARQQAAQSNPAQPGGVVAAVAERQ